MIASEMLLLVFVVSLLFKFSSQDVDCDDVSRIELKELIGFGAVKSVYRGVLEGRNVSLSFLRNTAYRRDFYHGLDMLKKYQDSSLVVKLLGVCKRLHVIVTEYHHLGDAMDIVGKTKPNVATSLLLCFNYAKILAVLHDATRGVTVHCDSNTLNKTLSQLLVQSDLSLVLNDVDSLAEMKNGGVHCGAQPITGTFPAPEQLWTNGTMPPGYDEKTDIWKAASVCEHFLHVSNTLSVQYHLYETHKRCKERDPSRRPTARELIAVYSQLIAEITCL